MIDKIKSFFGGVNAKTLSVEECGSRSERSVRGSSFAVCMAAIIAAGSAVSYANSVDHEKEIQRTQELRNLHESMEFNYGKLIHLAENGLKLRAKVAKEMGGCNDGQSPEQQAVVVSVHALAGMNAPDECSTMAVDGMTRSEALDNAYGEGGDINKYRAAARDFTKELADKIREHRNSMSDYRIGDNIDDLADKNAKLAKESVDLARDVRRLNEMSAAVVAAHADCGTGVDENKSDEALYAFGVSVDKQCRGVDVSNAYEDNYKVGIKVADQEVIKNLTPTQALSNAVNVDIKDSVNQAERQNRLTKRFAPDYPSYSGKG